MQIKALISEKNFFASIQLREAQIEVDRREGKIRELKVELETTRENEAKQSALVGTFDNVSRNTKRQQEHWKELQVEVN